MPLTIYFWVPAGFLVLYATFSLLVHLPGDILAALASALSGWRGVVLTLYRTFFAYSTGTQVGCYFQVCLAGLQADVL